MASVLKSSMVHDGINTAQTEVFNWEDIASRAKEYIDRVRHESQRMLEATRIECEQIRVAAHQEGIRTGENHIERLAQQMAGQIAEQRVVEATRSVQELCQDLEAATRDWLQQWQRETISFAIAIAEKLTLKQVDTDPTILLRWIEDSVRLVQGQRKVQLRIHTQDALRLSSALPELLEEMQPTIEVQLIEDDSVGRCGIVLQTPESTIHRSLQTQLKRLEEELVA